MQTPFFDQTLRNLSNLKFAISLLFAIGLVIAVGTIVEQDQTLSFYQQNYPENKPILGFLTWKFIERFNLGTLYTSPGFIILLVLFAVSLLSCSLTVQLPALRRFKRWKFIANFKYQSKQQVQFPINKNNPLSLELYYSHYHLFRQGRKNYAYTGLLGRVGPIIVHASIILLLVGSLVGLFGGYTVQELVPRGEVFHLQNVIKSGDASFIPQTFSWRVNDFWITYTEGARINQFYSDLSFLDFNGNELKRKKIFVNEPFVYKGLTLYQTDWDLVGLKLKVNGEKNLQIPVKKITKSGQKFWLGSINLDQSGKESVTLLVNDLQGTIYLYDTGGKLLGKTLLGKKFDVSDSFQLNLSEFLTATGLQVKIDPGLRVVYMSFFLLICSVYASFISFSEVWGVEKAEELLCGGKSNRAVLLFQSEFRKLSIKVTKV